MKKKSSVYHMAVCALMAAVMAVVIGLLFLVENRYGKDIDEE